MAWNVGWNHCLAAQLFVVRFQPLDLPALKCFWTNPAACKAKQPNEVPSTLEKQSSGKPPATIFDLWKWIFCIAFQAPCQQVIKGLRGWLSLLQCNTRKNEFQAMQPRKWPSGVYIVWNVQRGKCGLALNTWKTVHKAMTKSVSSSKNGSKWQVSPDSLFHHENVPSSLRPGWWPAVHVNLKKNLLLTV